MTAATGTAILNVRLFDGPFDPRSTIEAAAGSAGNAGGVASFTGYVSAQGGTLALELTHYAPLTLAGMEDLATSAQARFDLMALTIIHRVGMMLPGEPIVCVAAAARHRRDAIAAVDFSMDHLKSAAWFWKREQRADGWHWIEPRQQDRQDLARWQA